MAVGTASMSSATPIPPTSAGPPRRRRLDEGRPRVVIVGAGVAGIATAIALKRQLKYDNFVIYEKADSIGGTWRDHTYPGCGSDIPGHWYSLSSDLNPNWERRYATQPELRAYWEGLWNKYDLPLHTYLGTSVTFSEWDENTSRWIISVEEASTGKKEVIEAEVVYYALGAFTAPKYPSDVLGLGQFTGEMFHSSQWKHDVILEGKRIGVIGNGCSAAQFVPLISKDPSVQVVNFVRTPQWYVPKGDFAFPGWVKWAFAHVPFVLRWYRNVVMLRADTSYLVFDKGNKTLVDYTRRRLEGYIRQMVPKEYLSKLIPSYPPGCRRIIVDPEYLSCLHRPNVKLEWDGVAELVENGVKTKTGAILPFDVLIWATGYSIEPIGLNVKGREGKLISEYFESKQGPAAYVGACYPGFPNMFTLLGPNSAGGHSSALFAEEVQINHSLQLIKPILEGKLKSFDVTHKATDEYNEWVQKRLSTSVWTDCNSYYFHYLPGQNKVKSKNTATFPGPVTLFWWMNRQVRWDRFQVTGAEGWKDEQRNSGVIKWWSAGLLLGLAIWIGYIKGI
ncbi:FAD/NAD(P)-binding domain-containing protein [Coprinopsis marcescibilis]|uniref:FAD/NAD(P)-binding domain-containing protein n=1 Tax=Coprinopsis marcescibilis TaxID=230819 RepID=A0A5C3LBA0_COPMA|nr:FAD/NAD(P)-binding domain-containing protein [Coprinopsis marcescibilis]